GVTILSGANTYSGGTTIAGGTLSVASDANLGNLVGGLTFNGGLLEVTGTGFTSTARTIAWDAGGGGFDIADAANTFTLAQILTGNGGLTKAGAGTLLLTAINSYTGATTITGGTLRQGVAGALGATGAVTIASGATLDLGSFNTSIGSLAGAGNLTLGGTLTAGGDNTSTTFSGGISGTGGLTKTGTGRLNLTGTSSYSGATSLDGGTLSVNGSIANSAVTVNAGGTLGGNGTVGSTTLNGGTLSPGNSVGLLTVAGNLVFTAASSYLVEVTTAGADRVNATGTATLSGATVNASFAAGNYIDKQYTIVDAAGGIIGTFGTLANTNLPTNFKSSLGYDATHAYLNLVLDFTPTPGPTPAPVNNGLNINRTQVANALTGYFNRTGSIPLAFGALSPDGLTLVSGETATATQQATFDVMNQFMGLLTDPTVAGRDATLPFSAVFSFSDQTLAHAGVGRDALAMITKAVPRASTFEARWSVWASAFGGSRNTDGNAVTGSNNARASAGGVAVGTDYLLSPNTIAGFALSGGATSFSLANAGSGRSDLFQAGAHVRHSVGSAYLVAAAAYGWQEVTTDRSVGIDRLHANYTSNAFSARIEGGNRYLLPRMNGIGVTPYAAAQVTTLDLPGHAETVSGSASTFALNYSSKMVIAPRSELGLRSDKSFAVNDAILTLRGRAAWAHDYSTDRSIAAVFQTLPGAAFTVNGAAPSGDSALTTASAEMKFVNGVSVAATFDGEFSSVTRSYAGKGVVRYVW
ncbi:MAG: autotransporter domain-containing protein, partial [Tardiphaga sp.]